MPGGGGGWCGSLSKWFGINETGPSVTVIPLYQWQYILTKVANPERECFVELNKY